LFEYIHRNCDGIRRRNLDISIPVIRRSARLHFDHITQNIRRSARLHFDHITQNGDPFEREEARPLDFGHWSAHKLEQMSGFELSHGQAVAIGIAIDVTYANLMGWLSDADHQKTLECLRGIGFKLYHRVKQQANMGGRLTIPSIRGIGETFDLFEIDTNQMLAAISYLERFHGGS